MLNFSKTDICDRSWALIKLCNFLFSWYLAVLSFIAPHWSHVSQQHPHYPATSLIFSQHCLTQSHSVETAKLKTPGDDSWHLVSSAIVYVGPRTLQEVFNMLTLKSMKTCWYMSQQMGKLCAYLLELNQNTISTQLHQKRNSTATHSELNLHTSFSGISYWLGLKYFLIFKLFQNEIKN